MSGFIYNFIDWINSFNSCNLSDDYVIILSKKYYPTSDRNKILTHISNITWITYRNNFEKISNTEFDTDAGWGCMIRTTQMLCAEGLSRIMQKQNIYNLLIDNSKYPLSIHNFLINKEPGKWFGSNETCHMLSNCIKKSKLSENVKCIIEQSGILYKSDIKVDKSVFIFVTLRLGLHKIEEESSKKLLKCFDIKQCIGIIGGKPGSSYYFYGYQENYLLYLDPHVIQDSHNPQFQSNHINMLHINDLDPSICVGFFIKDQDNFNDFWNNIKDKDLIFETMDNRPKYFNFNFNFKKEKEWEFIEKI